MIVYFLVSGAAALGAPPFAVVAEPAWVPEHADQEPFIVPNEHEPWRFFPHLKDRGGVLLSVGTIRALNDAAAGNFSEAVLLDHDGRVGAFNRVNLQLMTTANSRFDYLLRLTNTAIGKEERARLVSGELKEADFWRAQLEPVKFRGAEAYKRRAAAGAPWLAGIPEAERPPSNVAVNFVLSISRTFDDPRLAGETIFTSDAAFAKVTAMARAGRIQVVTGSLSGARSMKSLGASLRTANKRVSAVDLSNALDHIVKSPNSPEAKAFIANLRELPLAPDAVALLTAIVPKQKGFGYFAISTAKMLGQSATLVGNYDAWVAGLVREHGAPCELGKL